VLNETQTLALSYSLISHLIQKKEVNEEINLLSRKKTLPMVCPCVAPLMISG